MQYVSSGYEMYYSNVRVAVKIVCEVGGRIKRNPASELTGVH